MFPDPIHRDRRPAWLICLDLQREFVVPGRPLYDSRAAAAIDCCAAALARARELGWTVVHAHRRRDGALFSGDSSFGAPIEGLRPLVTEPIYARVGLSAFQSDDFGRALRRARGAEVFLMGFSAVDSLLATSFAAIDARLSLTLVADAIGGGSAHGAPEQARATLGPYVRVIRSFEIDGPGPARLEGVA